jgi:hypothetical protein
MRGSADADARRCAGAVSRGMLGGLRGRSWVVRRGRLGKGGGARGGRLRLLLRLRRRLRLRLCRGAAVVGYAFEATRAMGYRGTGLDVCMLGGWVAVCSMSCCVAVEMGMGMGYRSRGMVWGAGLVVS